MGVITKVYTPGNIFESPVDVYVGIASPPSSATPGADANCLTLDSNGQPSSSTGFHLGSVEAPTTVSITEKANEISDDQHDGLIDICFVSIEAEVDFAMKETNLSRLQTMLNGGSLSAYNAITGGQALQTGGQTSTAVGATTLLLVAPRRDQPSLFLYALFYKVYIEQPISLSLTRSKESVYKVKAKCIMDTTRVPGDELGQVVRQT